jgi:DNA-binding NtrC family response regulator
MQYSYPGNIRELRNLLERAMLMADGDELHISEMFGMCCSEPTPEAAAIVPLEEAERRYVREALAQLGGDRKELARRLGISERTLYRKLAE